MIGGMSILESDIVNSIMSAMNSDFIPSRSKYVKRTDNMVRNLKTRGIA